MLIKNPTHFLLWWHLNGRRRWNSSHDVMINELTLHTCRDCANCFNHPFILCLSLSLSLDSFQRFGQSYRHGPLQQYQFKSQPPRRLPGNQTRFGTWINSMSAGANSQSFERDTTATELRPGRDFQTFFPNFQISNLKWYYTQTHLWAISIVDGSQSFFIWLNRCLNSGLVWHLSFIVNGWIDWFFPSSLFQMTEFIAWSDEEFQISHDLYCCYCAQTGRQSFLLAPSSVTNFPFLDECRDDDWPSSLIISFNLSHFSRFQSKFPSR